MMENSISALQAAGLRLGAAAQNIANLPVEDASAVRVATQEQPDGHGVTATAYQSDERPELVTEQVEQLSALRYAQGNGAVLRTQNEMLGTIINLFA